MTQDTASVSLSFYLLLSFSLSCSIYLSLSAVPWARAPAAGGDPVLLWLQIQPVPLSFYLLLSFTLSLSLWIFLFQLFLELEPQLREVIQCLWDSRYEQSVSLFLSLALFSLFFSLSFSINLSFSAVSWAGAPAERGNPVLLRFQIWTVPQATRRIKGHFAFSTKLGSVPLLRTPCASFVFYKI